MSAGCGVHHHVVLRRRGGAAGVARTLARLQAGSRPVSFSFEIDEGPGSAPEPCPAFACDPARLAGAAPPESLVHVHATRDWAGLLEGFLARTRPLVVTVHDCRLLTGGCVYPLECPGLAQGCPEPCPRAFADSATVFSRQRALVAQARPVLASPSGWLARQLRRAWPGLSVRLAPNGVDEPVPVDRRSARAALGLAPEAQAVVFLAHGGAGAAYKGGGRFEALWRRVKAERPLAVGLVVGGERAGRSGDLLELPYLEAPDLARVLAAGDVLAYPSLADNHPLVILEAMAAGLPVAAYAVGGIGEQIVAEEQGLLAASGDEAGLAAAVARLLGDRPLARRLADQARQRFARFFGAARMAADYDRIYAGACSFQTGEAQGAGEFRSG